MGQRLVQHRRQLKGGHTVIVLQNMIVIIEHFFEGRCESRGAAQVAQPQRPARCLILIAGANTAARGTNLVLAPPRLAGLIQRHVIRQDQWTGGRDLETVPHGHAAGFQRIDLLEQCLRGEDHTIADQTLHTCTQYA